MYLSLENQVKVRRRSLQRRGVNDLTLMEPYDESYLDDLTDLPINFIPPDFRICFNGKGDTNLHMTSYLLAMPTLCDKPLALKVMFVHSITEDAVTCYNKFVGDYSKASCRDMFRKFMTDHRVKNPCPISQGELVGFKQGSDEVLTDIFDWFNAMVKRVTKSPLSDPTKINMIMENSNLEYKLFFSHDGVPLNFNIMLDRVTLYERTKSQTTNTKSIENKRINELPRKIARGKAQ
ncbi:hypothetical protein AMTR_s00015p00213020 [Amborella trichopoda]|uniref:Retrotransposon gag domain-containing protein n=1 Tax=Amborella trichopoda TaxID=13333 RepID=W1PNX9_AMBTC|nr:hypothetical protein AMTR_s00015p00213020 [Amborella trichopoda]